MKKLIVFAWLMFAALTADAQRVVKNSEGFALKDVPFREKANLEYFETCVHSFNIYDALVLRRNNMDVLFLSTYVECFGRYRRGKFVPYSNKKSMKLAWNTALQRVDRTNNPIIQAYMRWKAYSQKAELSPKEQNCLNQATDFLNGLI